MIVLLMVIVAQLLVIGCVGWVVVRVLRLTEVVASLAWHVEQGDGRGLPGPVVEVMGHRRGSHHGL